MMLQKRARDDRQAQGPDRRIGAVGMEAHSAGAYTDAREAGVAGNSTEGRRYDKPSWPTAKRWH